MSVNNNISGELEDKEKDSNDIEKEIESNSKEELENLKTIENFIEVTSDEKYMDSSKRRHSESEIDNAHLKKSKLDSKTVEKEISENFEIFKEIDDKKDENSSNENNVKSESSTNLSNDKIEEKMVIEEKISNEDHETDDLLERLDAIDASNLRKPDLKLEDIDRTDLEKDDLLKRLEDAENGVETLGNILESTSKKNTENEMKLNQEETTCKETIYKNEEPVKNIVTLEETDLSIKEIEDPVLQIQSILNKDMDKPSIVQTETSLIAEKKSSNVDNINELQESSSILLEDYNLHRSETILVSDNIIIRSAEKKIITDTNTNLNIKQIESGINNSNIQIESHTGEMDFDDRSSIATNVFSQRTNEDFISSLSEDINISSNNLTNEINEENLENKIKNKIFSNVLMMNNNGSSTPNSNNSLTATNSKVYNSTPIQKPFEISSENVSKILDEKSSIDDGTDGSERSSEITESACCTHSETDSQTSDGLKSYVKAIKQCNGLSEIEDNNIPMTTTTHKLCSELSNAISMENGSSLDSFAENTTDCLYEISVWYEDNSIRFLSVEKFDKTKRSGRIASLTDSTDSSTKRSSNGSVVSLGPFSLPAPSRLSMVSSSNSSSSQKNNDGKFAIPALPPKSKHTVKGDFALCNYMIDYFTKMKQNLKDDCSKDLNKIEQYTPKTKGKEPVKKSIITKEKSSINDDSPSPEVDIKNKSQSINKRTLKSTPYSTPSQNDLPISSSSSSSSSSNKAELNFDRSKVGYTVLARWVDRKYYAGRIIESKPGNKFVVLFEDKATKTLPYDHIVFGTDDDVLPLLDQSLHVLTENEEYVCGLVTSFNKIDNKVIYNITTDSGDFSTTSSDIYLNDEQAKTIQNLFKSEVDILSSGPSKRTSRKVSSRSEGSSTLISKNIAGKTLRGKRNESNNKEKLVEPGFSGGTTKKGRRPKRTQPTNISESSDISDTLESDSGPSSPNCEAVYGVQPELQKTARESELHKIRIMTEYLGNDKSKYAEDIQGPIPKNKNFFRNKHFILTCTIAMKKPRESVEKKYDSGDDMKNKYKEFSSVPFFKEHTKKQIEAAGGKVYNHFEDIPKKNYKNCKLISPHPIRTARYLQCLAADIQAISHEWIIECCRKNSIVDCKPYALPSGWSITDEKYIKWLVGRNQRSATPLSNITILLVSQNKDFTELWSRVCKLAGAKVKLIKFSTDITQGENGYLLIDDEFPEEIKSIAEHFGITILQTVWVVQSLIVGKALPSNALLSRFQDDDY